MTNKNYILCILCFVMTLNVNAQDFEFHYGAGLDFVQVGSYWSPGLVVAPRLNILNLSDNASLGVATEASFLYYSTNNGVMELPEDRVGFDVPLMAVVNVGRAATEYSIEQMGFKVGVGYSFGQLTLTGQDYEIVEKSDGPVIMGGVRFAAFGNKTISFDVSQAFGRGTTRGSLNSLAVRFLYNFKDY